MRHGASLIAAMEGIGRPAFHIARELAQNSRSGLTIRFLSKKLELPPEEIEYLIDVNHRLFFFDLTKVKLVADGAAAVKRITDGLENYGDVPSLFRSVKALGPHEFRPLEERLGLESPSGKKAAAEHLLHLAYTHPDSVVEYVATRGFSQAAREVFDLVWQSKAGVMPVSAVRSVHGGPEHEVEQALAELFDGFALFELFRFDAEDRLVRAGAILAEIRQWREAETSARVKRTRLKPIRCTPERVESHGLNFSDRVCRLVAAVAARPARLRGDGDLFREDRQRLGEICPEDAQPSLSACLWAAQGVGWLARVDNELRIGKLEGLVGLNRLARHRVLLDWLLSRGTESDSLRILARFIEEMKPTGWYSVAGFVDDVLRARAENERPVLKSAGGHWRYVSPSASVQSGRALTRSLEETLLWLGLVDRAELAGEGIFRITELGRCFLTGKDEQLLQGLFPEQKAQIIVQPNFDVFVPLYDVDPLVTVPLERFATRTSSGRAAVYHLSKDSFTRAVQDGHDGGAFIEFLLTHNRGELPPNVMTTLQDWCGSMKRVRLHTLHVVEADDPLLLADLLHRRRLRKHLGPVDANRVLTYSKISKAQLTKELEKEGFVVE